MCIQNALKRTEYPIRIVGDRPIMVRITEGMRNMGLEHRLTILLDLEHGLGLLEAVTSGLMWTSLTPCLDVYTASSTDALIQWHVYTMDH